MPVTLYYYSIIIRDGPKKGVDQLKIFIGSFDAPRREIFKDTSQTGLPNRQEGQNQLQKFDILLNLEQKKFKGTGQSCRFPSLLFQLLECGSHSPRWCAAWLRFLVDLEQGRNKPDRAKNDFERSEPIQAFAVAGGRVTWHLIAQRRSRTWSSGRPGQAWPGSKGRGRNFALRPAPRGPTPPRPLGHVGDLDRPACATPPLSLDPGPAERLGTSLGAATCRARKHKQNSPA